jgi:hypothetical protein
MVGRAFLPASSSRVRGRTRRHRADSNPFGRQECPRSWIRTGENACPTGEGPSSQIQVIPALQLVSATPSPSRATWRTIWRNIVRRGHIREISADSPSGHGLGLSRLHPIRAIRPILVARPSPIIRSRSNTPAIPSTLCTKPHRQLLSLRVTKQSCPFRYLRCSPPLASSPLI